MQDESLRHEVESLLAEDANPSGFLETGMDASRAAPAAFALSIGARLGPYEISGVIGAGGMGEVYRAHDIKLHRDVALKVLPESLAKDPERISRFQREAQLLASFNHPHIAAIYGLEESNQVLALIMELVEGPTLAERMTAGPIALEEALEIAKQMGEALEAAHERGIIHRDLKPANVKITPEGAVKVLDFGLGKNLKTDSNASKPGSSPTRDGVILGTAPYMSPEQARGAAVDKRTDIWAFGVVLYEMLTHRRLFAGETISGTLAAVLTKEPDWDRVPVKAQRLLRQCLEKNPRRRLRDIADAWLLLEHTPQAPPLKNRLPWAVAATLAIAASIALWALWRATRPVTPLLQPLVRLEVDLGKDVALGSRAGADVILSADGSRLAYVSGARLFTRLLAQPNATEMAGTEGAGAPFFSPDGQWVAFFASGKLKKVSVQGGSAITLCAAPLGTGGSWGEDGNIIAALEIGGLSRISSAGGAPSQVTELASGEVIHRWPQILPGGRAVLFSGYTSMFGLDEANIEVMSLRDQRRKTLQRGSGWGRYLPSGHLVYIRNSTLFAVPFDVDRLEVRGTPVPVLERIAYGATSGSVELDFSRTGTLVYRAGEGRDRLLTVQWLDASGNIKPMLATPGDYMSPKLSPDGSRLALTSGGDIWVYGLRRDTMTRLTSGGGYSNPLWSPDGQYIAFRAAGGLFWTRANGADKPQPLIRSKNVQTPWSFTADGRRMGFVELNPASGSGLWTVPVERDGAGLRAGKPELFLQTSFNERAPMFSPDGRWLAYIGDETGELQVYVRAFPDGRGRVQISRNGGIIPLWSPNGRELFFMNLDDQIMVAAYAVRGDSFVPEKPRVWSHKRLAKLNPPWSYDLAPDGKHVIGLTPTNGPGEEKSQHHVVFLLNFFDELRRRVPPGAR